MHQLYLNLQVILIYNLSSINCYYFYKCFQIERERERGREGFPIFLHFSLYFLEKAKFKIPIKDGYGLINRIVTQNKNRSLIFGLLFL